MADDTEMPADQEQEDAHALPPGGAAQGLDPEAAKRGYVFDPESGFHWHPFAEHWFQPSEGIYLDMDGAPLDPKDAEAAVAESLARGDGLPEEEAEAVLAEPVPDEVFDLDDVGEAALPELLEAQPLEEPPPAELLEIQSLEEPSPAELLEIQSLEEPSPAELLDAEILEDDDLGEIPQAEPAVQLELPPLPRAAQPPEPAEWAPEPISPRAGWAGSEAEAPASSGEGKFGGLREAGLRVVDNELRLEESAPLPPMQEGYADPSEIPTHFAETRRVVIHLQNGAVQRGVVHGADLLAPAITLVTPSESVEIETRTIKAVFFMREPGASAPAPGGRKVQLTLSDGRNLQGFAPNPLPSSGGFYLLPADTVANTAWIYVYPHAIRDLDLA